MAEDAESEGMNREKLRRFELAGRLMTPPAPAKEAASRIAAMTPEDRDSLRGLVDWLQDYERTESERTNNG